MYKLTIACLLSSLLSVASVSADSGERQHQPFIQIQDYTVSFDYERQQHYRDERRQQPVRHSHREDRHHRHAHRHEHRDHKPAWRRGEQHQPRYVRIHSHNKNCRH